MTHTTTITPVRRRPFGLDRRIFIVRCGCGWRMETDNSHSAAVWNHRHTTYGGRPT